MSDRNFLRLQYKRLSLLNKTPQDPDAIKAWLDAVGDIAREVGEARLQAGVERCLRETQYFPTPHQLREMAPTSISSGTNEARTLRKTCIKCNRPPHGMVWGESVHPESGIRYPAYRECDHKPEADERKEVA
jgi:hypothetical protein